MIGSYPRGTHVNRSEPFALSTPTLAGIKPGALVDGAVLIEADLGYEIDNMEGLSVHRNAGGETVLTLISDDNFSLIQRTLLLQFALTQP
jgi:hypothetical protein